jgi:hypothetical protein
MYGPKTISTATTTAAIKTRIRAYSTKPCPSSCGGWYTKFTHLLLVKFLGNNKLATLMWKV